MRKKRVGEALEEMAIIMESMDQLWFTKNNTVKINTYVKKLLKSMNQRKQSQESCWNLRRHSIFKLAFLLSMIFFLLVQQLSK